MATKLSFLAQRHSISAAYSNRAHAYAGMTNNVLRDGGIVEHVRARCLALGVDYDHPLPERYNQYDDPQVRPGSHEGTPEGIVEQMAPFKQFLHAAHLYANAGVPPFALSIPVASRAGAHKEYWTRAEQLPVARGLMALYLECWQALDGLWEDYEVQDAISFDTSKTDAERYAAWSAWSLLGRFDLWQKMMTWTPFFTWAEAARGGVVADVEGALAAERAKRQVPARLAPAAGMAR